jgi:hypothetical protein
MLSISGLLSTLEPFIRYGIIAKRIIIVDEMANRAKLLS